MNFAQMLTGEWQDEHRRIKMKDYDTARARSARTRNREERLKAIPGYLDDGKNIFEIAEIYGKTARTISYDFRELARAGKIDKKYGIAPLRGLSNKIRFENPSRDTEYTWQRLYTLLCIESMTYLEMENKTGISRSMLINHMRKLEEIGKVTRTGKIPMVFHGIKGK